LIFILFSIYLDIRYFRKQERRWGLMYIAAAGLLVQYQQVLLIHLYTIHSMMKHGGITSMKEAVNFRQQSWQTLHHTMH